MSTPSSLFQPLLRALVLAVLAIAVRAQTYSATDRQPTPEELATLPAVVPEKAAALLKEVKVPDDFEVTIFATPPAVNYPVFVAAAPDGTLYVSSDGNGSLDRKPHLGRVLRVRDTTGDGQADEVKAFVPDVDSPRGLVWDYDRLYLLHPPDVSVFMDKDRDGVAEEQQTLIKGIGWTFKDRPADHGSNGLTLGIDGWLYAAIGDFGFMEATGTDGRKLQMRGGGVVRFRPDGTGLEVWAEGTRNNLEVAMSPLLDGFARDNNNDGGGWGVRLHHFSGYTQHGYPRLFKNFGDEIIQPLADYGGGSGCGAAWIDEPGIPAKWNNAPFTADWGTGWIYHHGLTPKGATFTATQEQFIQLPRVTDLDVDANSAIYAASWKGASFTWVGPDVGFIARITPKGYKPEPLPDFEKLSDVDLVKQLESPSHRRRLEAQRALLRRWKKGEVESELWNPVIEMANKQANGQSSRIAALFALNQGLGTSAEYFLEYLFDRDPAIKAWVARALVGSMGERTDSLITRLLFCALDGDSRARKEAVLTLAKTGSRTNGIDGRILAAAFGESDPIVAHALMQALIRLEASDRCLEALDHSPRAVLRMCSFEVPTPAQPHAAGLEREQALRVLQSLPEPKVVDALIARLGRIGSGAGASPASVQQAPPPVAPAASAGEGARRTVTGEAPVPLRYGLVTALCRLHFVEGTWKGDSWGTRPDTRGPFYQPEPWSETPKIAAALKAALDKADSQEAAFIGRELARHRIPAGDALDKLIARAATEPTLLPAIAAQLAEAEEVPASAIPLLVRTATAEETGDAARAQAVIALAKTASEEAWRAILAALPQVQRTKTENNLAEKARGAVNSATTLDQVHGVFEEVAPKLDEPGAAMAEGILLKLAARKVGSPEAREAAAKSLDAGWADPKRRVQILRAAAEVREASRAAQFVAALDDPDPAVAEAARETIRRLRIDPEKFRVEAKAARLADFAMGDVLKQVTDLRGDAGRGEQIFTQIGCNGCHTVKAGEPLKGPFLGTIATTYRRPELAEAILVPDKTLAQGFVAHHFTLKDGTELDGFVVQEAADAVTIRTITAEERRLLPADISAREKVQRSLMPEGLAAGLTLKEFASLLDYLEALPQQQ